jgi:hypothetical protein
VRRDPFHGPSGAFNSNVVRALLAREALMNVDDDGSSGDSEDENDAEESDDHPQSKHTIKAFVVKVMPKRLIHLQRNSR